MSRQIFIIPIFILFSGLLAFEDTVKLWEHLDEGNLSCFVDGETENSEEPIEGEDVEDNFEEYLSFSTDFTGLNSTGQDQQKWPYTNEDAHNHYCADILIPPPEKA